jgi:hypothetical protein
MPKVSRGSGIVNDPCTWAPQYIHKAQAMRADQLDVQVAKKRKYTHRLGVNQDA